MTSDSSPEALPQPGARALETRWPEPAPTSGRRCAPTNRYRGSVLAELFRALAALETLRAQARAIPQAAPALLELADAQDQTNLRNPCGVTT